jgi:hypothetical protein
MPITADELRSRYAEYMANENTRFQEWVVNEVPSLDARAALAARCGYLFIEVQMPGNFIYKQWNGQDLNEYISTFFPGCTVGFRTEIKSDHTDYFVKISW